MTSQNFLGYSSIKRSKRLGKYRSEWRTYEIVTVYGSFRSLRAKRISLTSFRSLTMALKFEDWYGVVSLKRERPQQPTGQKGENGVLVGESTSQGIQKYEEELNEWQRINEVAAPMILRKCEKMPASHIEHLTSANTMWTTLRDKHLDSSFAARHSSLQKLLHTTLTGWGGSV